MNQNTRFLLIAALVLNVFTIQAQSTRKKSTTKPVPATVADSTQKTKANTDATKAVSEKPLRKEFQAAKSSEVYYMIPTGNLGVSIIYPSPDKKNGMTEWLWSTYSTEFEETASNTFTVDSKLDYGDYYYDETAGHIYILFGKADAVPNFPVMDGYLGKFEIVDLDIHAKSMNRRTGEFAQKMHMNFMKSINGDLYIGGSIVPTKSQVRSAVCLAMITCFIGGKKRFDVFPYLVKITSKGVNEIKLPISNQGEVLALDYDSTQKKILCTALDAPLPVDRRVMVCELNSSGSPGKPTTIKGTNNYYLLNAQVQAVSATDKIVIGTYAKRDPKDPLLFGIPRKERNAMPASTGMYIVRISGTAQTFQQFYPFSKFADISDQVEVAKKEVEHKSDKKKAKAEAQFSYNILPHRIIAHGDQYIMIGEAYHSVYHSESYQTYNNGKWENHTRRVFDGWKYDYALVGGFDKGGDMKWNTTLRLSGQMTWLLREQVKVLQNPGNEKIVMVYATDGEIKSKVLNGETLEESAASVKIFTGTDEKVAKSSSNISYWYGNYFIAYGYQNLEKKNEKGKKEKRAVFFLNKVSYR